MRRFIGYFALLVFAPRLVALAETSLISPLRVLGFAREARVMTVAALERKLNVTLAKQDVACESAKPCPSLWGAKNRAMVVRLLSADSDRYRVVGGDFDVSTHSERELTEFAELAAIAAGIATDDVQELIARLTEKRTAGAVIPAGPGGSRGWLEVEALDSPKHTLRVHFEFD